HNAEYISAFFESFGMNSPLVGVGPADVHNRDPRELALVSAGALIVGDGVLAKAKDANVVFCQVAPWQFENAHQANLRRTYRRVAFAVTRLLANMGVAAPTRLLDRFHQPVKALALEQRWLTGFYVDQP